MYSSQREYYCHVKEYVSCIYTSPGYLTVPCHQRAQLCVKVAWFPSAGPVKSGIEGVTELQRIEAHTHRLSQLSCLYYWCFSYFVSFIFIPFHFSELNSCPSVWLEQCIHFCSAHLSMFEQIHSDPNIHIYTRFYRDQIHNPKNIHSMRKKAFHLIYFGSRGRERHHAPLHTVNWIAFHWLRLLWALLILMQPY